MKSLLLISILLLSGCTHNSYYQYDVVGQGCRNTNTYFTDFRYSYAGMDKHTPYLSGTVLETYRAHPTSTGILVEGVSFEFNFCSFSYTRSEIITK